MKAICKTKIKPGGHNILTEMEILKKLVHKNVIRLYEILDDPAQDEIYLIMDYLEGGTLQEKLQEASINDLGCWPDTS